MIQTLIPRERLENSMPVPSTIADLSTTAASNSPAGTDVIGTSLDDFLRAIQAIIKQESSVGADIASSSTISIPSSGSYFQVTGVTGITGINDSWLGRQVVLRFADVLTLTHSSGLVCPGSGNITTAAGDHAFLVNSTTGVWRVESYVRAASLPSTQSGTETLTNKTINLTSNTLSGTVAQFNTALSDGDFATLAGSETLTNKTLTTPVLSNPSFSGTTANMGTVTTIDINGGTIDGTTQASGTINGPIAAGGTWTAAATWTLPAHTLGGTVTSNGQSFSGTIANLGTVTTADINGGTIDGTVIGGASAAAGTFTTLSATGNVTLGDASTDTLNVGNGGLIKDASGNVGIGVAPTTRNNTTLQIKDGIGFPATQVASSDANTLDDYEEGTYSNSIGNGWTVGNGTESNRTYTKIGNQVTANYKIVFGSTSTYGSSQTPQVTLPFSSSDTTQRLIGIALLTDSGTTRKTGFVTLTSGIYATVSYSDASNTSVINTSPWTWATGDSIEFQVTYFI